MEQWNRNKALLVSLLAGAAIGLAPARAQDRPPPSSPAASQPSLEVYEGRPIRRLVLGVPTGGEPERPGELPYRRLDSTLEPLARNQIRLVEGAPFSQRVVADDVKRLNAIMQFKDVETRVQLLSDGTVNLYYLVTPQAIVTAVEAVGNTEITDEDLRKLVEILVGTPVDRFQLDRACRRIEELYRSKGYYMVEVSVDAAQLEETGIVLFRIREGEQLAVTKITFEGNKSYRDSVLRREIETTEAWLLNRGRLDDDQLDSDVQTIIRFYRNRGYLEARADRIVRPSPNGREAAVTFVIDEGPIYLLRDVRCVFIGADDDGEGEGDRSSGVIDQAQVRALAQIKPGDVYAQRKINDSIESVRVAYGTLGYTDVDVQRRELRVPGTNEVELLLIIREGRPYRTGYIEVVGNEITKKSVVLRHAAVRPDRPLSPVDVEQTELRLQDANLFAPRSIKVTPQRPDPADPGFRDVLIEVAETNTGSFQFGAEIGSDGGLSGRISLAQRNFDITDTPDSWSEFWSGRAFRGGGQTFQILLQPGTLFQNYQVSLFDPAVRESDYSASGTLFFRTADYNEFREQRVGARFSVGRRFGTRWTGSIPLRLEEVGIYDLSPDSSVDAFEVAGKNFITGLGVSMRRSTIDEAFRPSRGTVLDFGAEQIGALGGDFTFTAFRAEHVAYFTIDEDYLGRKTVLSLTTRAGYLTGGTSSVPIYERLYLGGQSFRGFRFRAVSPKGIRKDTGTEGSDSVGGTWMFFFGPQVAFPLYSDILGGVAFLDTGTVTNSIGFEKYRVSAGIGLRIYVRMLSPAPLAFDFAVPVTRESTDSKRLFTFKIDIPL